MDTMSELDKDLLLKVILHCIDPETRRRVMWTLPNQYNRWVGQQVMSVMHVDACPPVREVR